MVLLRLVFLKFLAVLVTVYVGVLMVFDEQRSVKIGSLSSLFRNYSCIRRNGSNRWSEGYHYPNQTLYRFITSEDAEKWMELVPVVSEHVRVIVLSLTKNHDEAKRSKIRRTWADRSISYLNNSTIAVLFLLGNNAEDMDCLQQEQASYNDLLVVRTRDSYRGLVYKLLMAMRFIVYKYPEAHVVKIDEDVVLDIRQLMGLLNDQPNSTFMRGYPFFGAPVIREENHTFFVPLGVYPAEWHPWYLNGNFYIISNCSLRKLMDVAPQVSIFEIEDVFITGVLRTKANLTFDKLPNSGFYQPSYPLCTEEYYEILMAQQRLLSPSNDSNTVHCLIYLKYGEPGHFEKAKVYWKEFWTSQNLSLHLA